MLLTWFADSLLESCFHKHSSTVRLEQIQIHQHSWFKVHFLHDNKQHISVIIERIFCVYGSIQANHFVMILSVEMGRLCRSGQNMVPSQLPHIPRRQVFPPVPPSWPSLSHLLFFPLSRHSHMSSVNRVLSGFRQLVPLPATLMVLKPNACACIAVCPFQILEWRVSVASARHHSCAFFLLT